MELRPYEEEIVRKRGPLFFWWSLVLLLLAGACFASWLGSFYVISHPEVPRCYRFLKKLKRLDSPKRFAVTEAPRGEFLTPFRMLERYGTMGPAELERENAMLLRAYIMNYRESKRPVVYVTGKYDVVEAVPLTADDFFPTGVALVSQAIEHPQLVLETLFTAPEKTVAAIKEALPIGSDLTLQRARDLFALIHVARLEEGRMQFTTIPLPYGGIKNKAVEFTLRSPEELEKADPKFALNIDAGLPVVRGERLSKGLAAYAAFRRKALAGTSGDQRALTAPELELFEVRLAPAADAASPEETVPVPDEPPPPLPTGAPTTPRPVAAPRRPQGAPLPPVPLAPRPVVLNAPTPPEPVPPVAVPVGRVPGAATPPPAALPAVPLPEQRVVTTAQASSMVGDFKAGERIYLTGDFVVTGVHGQRAGLRTRDSLRDAKADPTQPGTTAAFIVVDFPPGVPPPKRDSVISREADRGFEIRDVIRDRNGQITIVATDRRQ